MAKIGTVIIGRNEGERLRRCFMSVVSNVEKAVYVDSGSSDSSLALAKSFEIETVELDLSKPFTAARARNIGFETLLDCSPDVDFVQFIDGDCEILPGWIVAADKFLSENPLYAIVCGRLHERFPEKSIFNQLCDIEWDGPTGDINACGGIFLIRTSAYRGVNGMNEDVTSGEEPEMCLRLKKQGWMIHRLGHDMALHDANITAFSQWWARAVRSGYSYALGFSLHGLSEERYRLRDCLRIWFWGGTLPLLIVFCVLFESTYANLIWLVYAGQGIKIFLIKKHNYTSKKAFIYAFFSVVDKFPQLWGQLIFVRETTTKKMKYSYTKI